MADAQRTDIVVLRNSDQITGEIKSLSQGKLSYKTDDAGTLSIEWDKVILVESVREHEIRLTDGRILFGPIEQAEQTGRMVVHGETILITRVVDIVPIRAEFFQRTKGYVDLGLTVAKARSARTFNLGWKGEYRGTRWGSTISGSSYIHRSTDTELTQTHSARVQGQRFISGRWLGLLSVDLTRNDELSLDLRETYSVGGKYRALETIRSEMSVSGGFAANRELFQDSESADLSWELTASFRFDAYRYDSPKFNASVTLNPYFGLSDWGRFRGDFETRVTYEVFSDFNIGATFRDTFDLRPPSADAQRNDYTLTVTIGWSWG
jgi:hypothetical protein